MMLLLVMTDENWVYVLFLWYTSSSNKIVTTHLPFCCWWYDLYLKEGRRGPCHQCRPLFTILFFFFPSMHRSSSTFRQHITARAFENSHCPKWKPKHYVPVNRNRKALSTSIVLLLFCAQKDMGQFLQQIHVTLHATTSYGLNTIDSRRWIRMLNLVYGLLEPHRQQRSIPRGLLITCSP